MWDTFSHKLICVGSISVVGAGTQKEKIVDFFEQSEREATCRVSGSHRLWELPHIKNSPAITITTTTRSLIEMELQNRSFGSVSWEQR